MVDSHRTQDSAFNDLLYRLNEVASQLAQQYQLDMQAASSKNKILRVTFDENSIGNFPDCQNGHKSSPPKASALWETEANEIVPRELTVINSPAQEIIEPEKLQEMLWEAEANQMVPREDACPSAPENLQEISEPLGLPTSMFQRVPQDCSEEDDSDSDHSSYSSTEMSPKRSPKFGQTSSLRKLGRCGTRVFSQHFKMRSPWIDQRDFDNLTLQEVMSEEMFAACIRGGGLSGFDVDINKFASAQDLFGGGYLRWLVAHPESRARGCWVLACVILLLYEFIMVPVDVCFDLEETAFSKAMDVSAATFWTLDVVLTFFVGVPQGRTVEMDPSKIAIFYVKSWFLFDIFLLVPEWVTIAIADDSFPGGQVSVFRMARWGRLMRLLRMARILTSGKLKPLMRLMRRLIYVLNVSRIYLQMLQAFAGLSLVLIGYIHIISCLWYAIGNSSDDGWVSVNGLKSENVGNKYVASVHWSISRLHGIQSYNEIVSVTDFAFDGLLIYATFMLAAYYNGKVAAVAMTSANAQSLNLWKLSVLFAKKYKISSGLDMKMAKFLECSTAGGAMESAAEERTLLDSLPKTLQHDLLFEARLPFLLSKPFLKELLAANSRVVHQISTAAIAQKVYVDGELVFEIGDACHGMLFVTSGVLYYIPDNSNRKVASIRQTLYAFMSTGPPAIQDSGTKTLEANSSVSEPVLWTHWTHLGSLLTIEESISLVLSPSGFSQVVADHREAFFYAFKYAKRFLWQLNETRDKGDGIDDLTAYHKITIKDLDFETFEGNEYDHFLFLSHYKVEAGTEATLMRDLFEEILREDPTHSAKNLRSPIFVDSEDLTDLSMLKEHVKGSAVFVLLLTPGVLSRGWCLVEIVTAVKHKVNIVPVEIQRPGSKYNYPDDQFYADILDGKVLDQAAVDLLEGEGMSLSDVEKALRKVFLKIAAPFSPHKTKTIREAELHDIFTRCNQDPTRSHSASSFDKLVSQTFNKSPFFP